MSEPAIGQVEDRLKTILEAYAPLAGRTVIVDQSDDIAIEADEPINIYTVQQTVGQADEQNQTLHTATIEIETVSRTQALGTINRANQKTIAHVLAAIAADRTLGIGIQDIQELDIAPGGANGKDAGSASIQFSIQYFTSRSDWFTIV